MSQEGRFLSPPTSTSGPFTSHNGSETAFAEHCFLVFCFRGLLGGFERCFSVKLQD